MKKRFTKTIIIFIIILCMLGIVQAIYNIPMWSL